ncbi:hypothetical protein [Pannonibacter phragmitetus]|uniref:hypothetical protein n=1 Tax=Pannonibacter phragmitetus TaxID=121719 RepID=UPI0019822A2A|nr:hypothetical protein [Pannonibacter phragmitetus]
MSGKSLIPNPDELGSSGFGQAHVALEPFQGVMRQRRKTWHDMPPFRPIGL